MNAQLAESLRRFVLPALAGALLAGISVWTASRDLEGAILAAAVTLLTPLAGAAGWGAYDGRRAERGDVRPADVGPKPFGDTVTVSLGAVTEFPPPNRPGGV